MASKFLDSTIAQILEDIISQISFEGESHSNIADILLSILNQTPYDEEPKSVIADLFLKLKAKIEGEPFDPNDKEYLSTIGEILVSILEETEYDREPQSRIAELLLELKAELESFIEITVSGSVVSFNTKVSKPAVNLEADIVATQNLHGQSAPYPSGGQLWDEEYKNGYRDTTNGQVVPNANNITNKNLISVVPNSKIYFKTGTYSNYRILQYDANGDYLNISSTTHNAEITLDSECYFVAFSVGGSTYNHDISINANSADISYHPYSNICPIGGWDRVSVVRCGVNLWDEEWELGGFAFTGGNLIDQTDRIRNKNLIRVSPSTTYYIKAPAIISVANYDKDGNYLGYSYGVENNTFITKAKCEYIRFMCMIASYNNNISINYPSTDTEYHAYTGDDYTIQLGDEIFGGKVNFTTGVMEVTRKKFDLSTIPKSLWVYQSQYDRFYSKYDITDYGATQKTTDLLLFENMLTASGSTLASIRGFIDNFNHLFITGSGYTSVDDLYDYILNGHYAAISIQPITVQLTPEQVQILKGNNTLFADSGNIKLTYLDKT